MRLRATLVCVALAATALGGCGGGGDSATSSAAGSAAATQDRSGQEGDSTAEGQKQPAAGKAGQVGLDRFLVAGGDSSIPEFGAEAGAAEQLEAARSFHAYLDARADRDYEAACSHLASAATSGFEGLLRRSGRPGRAPHGCAAILSLLSSSAPTATLRAATRVSVGPLRISGRFGYLLYLGPGNTPNEIPMANEDGVWKVAAIEGSRIT